MNLLTLNYLRYSSNFKKRDQLNHFAQKPKEKNSKLRDLRRLATVGSNSPFSPPKIIEPKEDRFG